MKFTRFVIVAVSVIIGAAGVNAQKSLSYGVNAGLEVSKAQGGDNAKVGFNVGVGAEYGFARIWFVDAWLKFNLKPWEVSSQTVWANDPDMKIQGSVKYSASPYTLTLPIRIGNKFVVNDNVKIFGAVGPYIGVGLGGKCKMSYDMKISEGGSYSGSASEDIDNIYDNNDGFGMKRFEVGATVAAGVELFNHWRISLDYSIQINNCGRKFTPIDRNQSLGVNFGYKF